MAQPSTNKRRAATAAIKALITAAAVAATVAGWALLPANDPPTTDADAQTNVSVLGATDPGLTDGAPGIQAAPTVAPDPAAPPITAPPPSYSRPRPFTRSHSSR